jgi:hypothetical protein
MLALSVLARMPLGINALAIVLLLRHEGYSFVRPPGRWRSASVARARTSAA